ncbi:MAG: hypothetical protein L3J71_07895 [Victivallaceae bacterium]|nr:hypothetical protein [Victivallaceae bacterium]
MDIYFKTRKLQKICNSAKESIKVRGKQGGIKLQQRLVELRAAIALVDISHLPPPKCHELINRQGVFSVNLESQNRLLFISTNDPIPFKSDGGIDLTAVTEIEIIEIEDTHDKKKSAKRQKG